MCLEEVFQVREDSTKNQNIFLVDVSEGGGGETPWTSKKKHTLFSSREKMDAEKSTKYVPLRSRGGGPP